MGFLSPWFLAGLGAVALPLWVHLLRQHKSDPIKFSSLMFFEPRTQSSIKHRRLKHLMLLAARIAVFALLVLAFANPYVMRKAAPGAGQRNLTVIVIDRSFSMRAGGRLDQAKREAAALLSGWNAANQGQVLALDAKVRQMTQATTSAEEMRAAIRSIGPGDGKSAYGEMARALRSLAESARIPLEVHLFSDMQKSAMPSGFTDLRLAGDTRLVLHAVGTAGGNFAVENVSTPHHVTDPKKVRLKATLAGYGTAAATKTASLVVNGKVQQSRPVAISANGRASVEFVGVEAGYGMNRGEVRIDGGDDLPQDDTFFFSLDRTDPQRVLFVYEGRQPRGVLYYRTALESAENAPFVLEPVTTDQVANIAPEKFAFTILSDAAAVPAMFEAALKNYVKGGGGVLVSLGPAAATRTMVPVIEAKVLASNYASRGGDRYQVLADGDTAHPSLLNTNHWENVRFYQSFQVQGEDLRVLARLSDRTPVLLEKRIGEGRILLFTSTFDNISNDFPLHPAFVPFVEQTARYLAGMEDAAAASMVDSYAELRRAGTPGGAVEVLGPDGKRALSLKEAASAQNVQLERAGFYEVRRANGRHELVAVNVDRRESDLQTIPEEARNLWQGTPSGTAARRAPGAESDEKPRSLWWYVALALLAMAVTESVLGSRYLTVEKEAA